MVVKLGLTHLMQDAANYTKHTLIKLNLLLLYNYMTEYKPTARTLGVAFQSCKTRQMLFTTQHIGLSLIYTLNF